LSSSPRFILHQTSNHFLLENLPTIYK
jgi:hypothetical protein